MCMIAGIGMSVLSVGFGFAAGTLNPFTIGVTDAGARTASAPVSITVVQALDVVTTTLRDAKVGRPYRTTLRARGGDGRAPAAHARGCGSGGPPGPPTLVT